MLITRAYAFRLQPTLTQRAIFARFAGVARYAYNWTVGRIIEEEAAAKASTDARAGVPRPKSVRIVERYTAKSGDTFEVVEMREVR